MVVRMSWLAGLAICLTATVISSGCARYRQSPYAYAPPYAPPVYPQPGAPQQAVPAQPVAYPAPGAVQTPLPPGAVMPMAPTTVNGGFSQTMPAPGVVPTGATMPCPPTCDPCAGAGMVTPVVYEGAVQTQPCPPGM